jgi:vacuolar-type H+-ATPase subunit E/Vma4
MSNKWGFFASVAGFLALCAVVESTLAQERGRGGMMLGRSSLVMLANAEPVQNELSLESEAKEKIRAMADQFSNEAREQFQSASGGNLQNASPEERQQMMAKMQEVTQKLNAKYTPKLKEILKPEQYQRLQQISWQAGGAAAFNDPELVQALNVTKEQQERIAAVNQDYQQKMRGLFGGGNAQDAFAKMRELNQERDQKAVEVLTKEQQEKFKELKGKPFDLAQLRQGRPGGDRKQNQN